MENMQELMIGEEINLSKREENEFLWVEFLGEEEDLTDKEKEYWEVRK